ncbi:MAG: DinB family protein [Bacteroidota bacterium]|nr:DinB family protein [Bacteroidota bacterium]
MIKVLINNDFVVLLSNVLYIFDDMTSLTSAQFNRPAEGDCDPYYFRYTDMVPEVDIATFLHTQRDWFGDWIESLSAEDAQFRYAEGKWSLAEMIGHVLDTERIFAYRMLCISRNDQSLFPGFDQDDYAAASNYHEIKPVDLANEWRAIRSSTLYLLRHMNQEMASRMGTANNKNIRASAFPFIMGGHVVHHYRIAQERYLTHPS